jgi:hypothetical protein
MEAIFEKMLKVTLSNLRQLEAKGYIEYKVIHGKEEHGNLVVGIRKVKRASPLNLPRGDMREYVLPWVVNMQPGDLVEIPYGQYPPENVRANAGAWASGKWGSGTYTSTINRKSGFVELYRYPLEELQERTS